MPESPEARAVSRRYQDQSKDYEGTSARQDHRDNRLKRLSKPSLAARHTSVHNILRLSIFVIIEKR
jgi:hypothetical protein